MGRLPPKRPHRFRIRPQRNPSQPIRSSPRQRPHRSTPSLPRKPRSLLLRLRLRHLRLRRQFQPPPLLRLGRRRPQTRQHRSRLRPIRQPLITPLHQRPLLLPLSRPRRPRLQQIHQRRCLPQHRPLVPHPLRHQLQHIHRRLPLCLPRHRRPFKHPPIPQHQRRLPSPLQHRAQPTRQPLLQ